MYTVLTSILVSCLAFVLGCFLNLFDLTVWGTITLMDIVFVPLSAASAVGLVCGIALAKIIGLRVPLVKEATHTCNFTFNRDKQASDEDFYCFSSDLASGENVFHVFATNANNLTLIKSLWANKTTEIIEDQSLIDCGIWKKTRLIPDSSSRLYHWGLAKAKNYRNELYLPPAMATAATGSGSDTDL